MPRGNLQLMLYLMLTLPTDIYFDNHRLVQLSTFGQRNVYFQWAAVDVGSQKAEKSDY